MDGIWEFHWKKMDPGFTFEGPIPQEIQKKNAPKTVICCGVVLFGWTLTPFLLVFF